MDDAQPPKLLLPALRPAGQASETLRHQQCLLPLLTTEKDGAFDKLGIAVSGGRDSCLCALLHGTPCLCFTPNSMATHLLSAGGRCCASSSCRHVFPLTV